MNANLQDGQDGQVDLSGDAGVDGDAFVVDFSEVGEEAGFTPVPRGIYNAIVDDCTYSLSQSSNNPMWTWKFEIADGEHAKRKLFFHSVFAASSMPRTKKVLGVLYPEGLAGQFSPKAVAESGVLLGRPCRIRVDIKPYQGEPRNNVRDVLPPDAGASTGESFL